MRWFTRRPRSDATRTIPAFAVPVAHVIGPGRLSIDGERIVHEGPDGVRQATVLLEGLELITCYGAVTVEPFCLRRLAEGGVAVAFLSADGSRFVARISPEGDPRVLGRVLQHRVLANPMQRMRIANEIVADKIHSQAASARHYQRQGKGVPGDALKRLADLERRASDANAITELLGLEGVSSALWYEIFGKLLRKSWRFERRSRRPPVDPVNSVLSLGYTLLYRRMIAACQSFGLESGIGALHAYRAGRQSLACDLMEPLRAPLVDRWVIGLVNQGRVSPEDFQEADDGGVRLTKRALPRVVADWEHTWREPRSDSVVTDRTRGFVLKMRQLSEPLGRITKELSEAGIAQLG